MRQFITSFYQKGRPQDPDPGRDAPTRYFWVILGETSADNLN